MRTLIENFLKQQATDDSFLRMLLFSALEGHDLARKFVTGHMREFYRFLGTYFSQRMEEGALKPMDPQLAARLLMGMVVIVVPHRETFQDPIMTALDIEGLPAQVVDLFCHGILAAEQPPQALGIQP